MPDFRTQSPSSPKPALKDAEPRSRLARDRVQLWVRSRRGNSVGKRLLSGLITVLGIGGGLLLLGGALWLGAQLMLQPQSVSWLNRWSHRPAHPWGTMPSQSLPEIAQQLPAQQRLGEPLSLASLNEDLTVEGLWLLPVWQQQVGCADDCEAIAALRLYGQVSSSDTALRLQLLDELTVQGPTETAVLAPAVRAGLTLTGSPQRQPLTEWVLLGDSALPGIWMTLKGRWRQGGGPILYGQVICIDAQGLRVRSLLNWSSPPGRLPRWQDLDQTSPPELIIDQQVGLEPHFEAYTVEGGSAALQAQRLTPITLQAEWLPNPQQASYQQALQEALQGLWSSAYDRLTDLRQELGANWPQAAEQQRQLIGLHAQVTQVQADRTWAQPSQQVLVLLVDGRWEAALSQLQSLSLSSANAVRSRLAADSGRLWQRVVATLRTDPQNLSARVWGALLLTAQQDEGRARAWLAQADGEMQAAAMATYETALAVFQPPTAAATPSAEIAEERPSRDRLQAWIGTATPLSTLQPGTWHRPSGAVPDALSPGQQWYRIDLIGGLADDRWQGALGLLPTTHSDAAVQAAWQSLALTEASNSVSALNRQLDPAMTLQIEALGWGPGRLVLLARGPKQAESGTWLVAAAPLRTPDTLATTSLAQVARENDRLSDRLLAALSDWLPVPAIGATGESDTLIPSLDPAAVSVRRHDWLQDGQPELLLELAPEAVAALQPVAVPATALTLMVDQGGQVIYSDIDRPGRLPSRRFVAWLPNPNGVAGLLVQQGDRYRLYTWSAANQRFQ